MFYLFIFFFVFLHNYFSYLKPINIHVPVHTATIPIISYARKNGFVNLNNKMSLYNYYNGCGLQRRIHKQAIAKHKLLFVHR